MNSAEIRQQLEAAEQQEKEAEAKHNEATASAKSVIERADRLVSENETHLAAATGQRDAASTKVGQLKGALEDASRRFNQKTSELGARRHAVIYCDNVLQGLNGLLAAAQAEVQTNLQKSSSCEDPKQKMNFEANANAALARAQYYEKKIATFSKLKYKERAKSPSVEKAAEEYKATMENVRPRLESAEKALAEAVEEEKKAEEALKQAKNDRERDAAASDQKIREAADAHERAKICVAHWRTHMNSALHQLQSYAGRD